MEMDVPWRTEDLMGPSSSNSKVSAFKKGSWWNAKVRFFRTSGNLNQSSQRRLKGVKGNFKEVYIYHIYIIYIIYIYIIYIIYIYTYIIYMIYIMLLYYYIYIYYFIISYMFPCPRVKGQKCVLRGPSHKKHSFGWHVDDVTKAPPHRGPNRYPAQIPTEIRGFQMDFMGFYGGLMGFNGILMGF